MTKSALTEFYLHLVGPAGCFIPEAGYANSLVCIVLHGNLYDTEISLSRKTALKHISGGAPIPAPIQQHYTNEEAWLHSLADMDHLLTIITAPTRVRFIQRHVHDWLPQSGLDPHSLAVLEHFYNPKADLKEIAEYFALIRLFILT